MCLCVCGAVVTGMNVIAIMYVLFVGAPFTHASNLVPFAPFGVRGIFSAASVVFFAFVGFDSMATVAEEVRLSTRSCLALLPRGGEKLGTSLLSSFHSPCCYSNL